MLNFFVGVGVFFIKIVFVFFFVIVKFIIVGFGMAIVMVVFGNEVFVLVLKVDFIW